MLAVEMRITREFRSVMRDKQPPNPQVSISARDERCSFSAFDSNMTPSRQPVPERRSQAGVVFAEIRPQTNLADNFARATIIETEIEMARLIAAGLLHLRDCKWPGINDTEISRSF